MNTLFSSEKLHTREKLPARQILGYLSGMVPTVLMIGFFGFAYSKFFLDDLKLDPKLWYIGLAIYGIINAFNDPIIGYLSDSTNAKKVGSRRLIYILIVPMAKGWFYKAILESGVFPFESQQDNRRFTRTGSEIGVCSARTGGVLRF